MAGGGGRAAAAAPEPPPGATVLEERGAFRTTVNTCGIAVANALHGVFGSLNERVLRVPGTPAWAAVEAHYAAALRDWAATAVPAPQAAGCRLRAWEKDGQRFAVAFVEELFRDAGGSFGVLFVVTSAP